MSQGAFVLVESCPANVALWKYPIWVLRVCALGFLSFAFLGREWVSVSAHSGSLAVTGVGATCSPC